MAFCPVHPKWDQNPSIPTPFICGVPPRGSLAHGGRFGCNSFINFLSFLFLCTSETFKRILQRILRECENVLFSLVVMNQPAPNPRPFRSCKDIRDAGYAKGDGKYIIDPENNGNPLKVYCDMTTDGGKIRHILLSVISQAKYQAF